MILLKNDKFANKKWKGVKSQKKKYFRCFEVSTCPLGQVRTCPNHDFSGPDMTKSGLLVKF